MWAWSLGFPLQAARAAAADATYLAKLSHVMETFLYAQAGGAQVKPPIQLTDDDVQHKMFLVLEQADGWTGTADAGVPLICAEPTWHLQNWSEVNQFKDIVDKLRALAVESFGDGVYVGGRARRSRARTAGLGRQRTGRAGQRKGRVGRGPKCP